MATGTAHQHFFVKENVMQY